jgi:hypothetical protein
VRSPPSPACAGSRPRQSASRAPPTQRASKVIIQQKGKKPSEAGHQALAACLCPLHEDVRTTVD